MFGFGLLLPFGTDRRETALRQPRLVLPGSRRRSVRFCGCKRLIAGEDNLIGLDVFGLWTSISSDRVPGLHFERKRYPLDQFQKRKSLFDVCMPLHWHMDGMVFSVKSPDSGVFAPDTASCGFSAVGEVPIVFVTMPVDEWNAFHQAHPAPSL